LKLVVALFSFLVALTPALALGEKSTVALPPPDEESAVEASPIAEEASAAESSTPPEESLEAEAPASMVPPAPRDRRFEFGVHGGTLGLGATAAYRFAERFALRGTYNRFDFDFDKTKSGNEYDGDLGLESYGLMLDFHPFNNGFRLTAGAYVNDNALAATAEASALDVGGNTYSGALNANLGFKDFAPYFGIGWSGGFGKSGLGLTLDAGALVQGAGRLSADGRLAAAGLVQCNVSVSRQGMVTIASGCPEVVSSMLASDLEAEHEDLRDSLDDYKLYPVVVLGLIYRF